MKSFKDAFKKNPTSPLAGIPLTHGSQTLACEKCKSPLWDVVLGPYNPGLSSVEAKRQMIENAIVTSYPGVPPYSEYWERTSTGAVCLNKECPKCGDDYFKAVAFTDKGKIKFMAKPGCPELDNPELLK